MKIRFAERRAKISSHQQVRQHLFAYPMAIRTNRLHRTKRLLMNFRRRLYELRSFVPVLRERHRLEALVGPLGFWDELQHYQMHTLRTRG